jgi:hypothetical protein
VLKLLLMAMSLIKRPSAWIPIALSLMWVAFWIFYLVMFGPPRPEPDEGTAAHLFQLWLVLEALLLLYFTIRWLPPRPKQALPILILQIALVIVVCAPVRIFHL